jgi:hemoglobin-like flavoprotein
MRADQLKLVQDSYARCCEAPGFFETLYQRLLGSSSDIPPMFSQTDFERQHKVLQHGLGVLLIYAKRRNPALLERIAARHSRSDVNVAPELYPFFEQSLIAAVRQHDPEYAPEVEAAWRAAVAPGIEFMKERY